MNNSRHFVILTLINCRGRKRKIKRITKPKIISIFKPYVKPTEKPFQAVRMRMQCWTIVHRIHVEAVHDFSFVFFSTCFQTHCDLMQHMYASNGAQLVRECTECPVCVCMGVLGLRGKRFVSPRAFFEYTNSWFVCCSVHALNGGGGRNKSFLTLGSFQPFCLFLFFFISFMDFSFPFFRIFFFMLYSKMLDRYQ